jgi:hypothetical protein
MISLFTIGFSTHRLESLPFAREEMRQHEVIVLEEPPSPTLEKVFRGQDSVENYLWELDAEFPEFGRSQIKILLELWQQGKTILQVEPYLERLVSIHELFAGDTSPEEVMSREDLKEVYVTEKGTSAALLAFYKLSLQAPFHVVVDSVKQFARVDADRFRRRDAMRAEALAELAGKFSTIYVEAGHMHLALPGRLHRQVNGRGRIRSKFLMSPALPRQSRPRIFGPGDELTFRHIFHRPLALEIENLLAAQSLIYIKMLSKEELSAESSPTPHLDEEIYLNFLVRRLSYQDCEILYPRLKRSSPAEALQEVVTFLNEQEFRRPQDGGSVR